MMPHSAALSSLTRYVLPPFTEEMSTFFPSTSAPTGRIAVYVSDASDSWDRLMMFLANAMLWVETFS